MAVQFYYIKIQISHLEVCTICFLPPFLIISLICFILSDLVFLLEVEGGFPSIIAQGPGTTQLKQMALMLVLTFGNAVLLGSSSNNGDHQGHPSNGQRPAISGIKHKYLHTQSIYPDPRITSPISACCLIFSALILMFYY